jgi:hypothetical protein
MRRHHLVFTSAAALAVAGVLTSCGSDSTAPRATPTPAQTQAIGEAIASQIESSLSLILPGDITTPPFLARQAMRRMGVGFASPLALPANCPTITPAQPADNDADGVPTTLSIAYPAGCTDTQDSLSITVSGTLSVTDPTPSVADLNFNAALANLKFHLTAGRNSATITTNGSFSGSGNASGVSQSSNMTLSGSATGQSAFSYSQTWTASFTPAQGQTIANGTLPAGTFSASGTTSFSSGRDSFGFTMATITPLQYDPACAGPNNFQSGEIHATLTGSRGTGFVSIVWSGCGDATITFSGTGTP